MGIEGQKRSSGVLPARVIVVDAEPSHREFVRLAMAGSPDFAIVAEASSLPEVFSYLTTGSADVALVDLLMPGIHGFQVAHRLRQFAPQVQIVVTGDEDGAHLHHLARACGAAGYIERKALCAQSVCDVSQHGFSSIRASQEQTESPLAA